MAQLLISYGWILDVAFFAVLLIGTFLGVGLGFLRGICKFAGAVLAVAVAVFFCTPLTGALEDWFGLVTMLAGAVHSEVLAYWLIVAACFLVLGPLTYGVVFLVGKLGKALVQKISFFNAIDRVLGGILGFAEALLLIVFLLAVCSWIHVDVIDGYIASSYVVGPLYTGGWFTWLAGVPWRFLQDATESVSLLSQFVV